MNNFLQLGQAAINSRNMAEAVNWFEKAVQETPLDPQALACLGQALCWENHQKQGLSYLHKAGKQLIKKARKSKDTRQLLMMAEQLQFWNDYPNSLELVKQAVQINKKDIHGFQILAHTYSRLNKNELALSASKQAIKKAPKNAILNIQQATLEARTGQYETAMKRLQSVLENPASDEEQFRAHKELAVILDKTGQYNQVFSHLNQSAELSVLLPEVKKQNKAFVPDMLKAYTSSFDRKLLHRRTAIEFKQSQPAPVFLIGFLRSGTTLTQEVLDTHPEVFISDETDLVAVMREELNKISHGKGNAPEQLRNADLNTLEHLRNFYWDRAKNRYGQEMSGKLFIDKTTMNTFDIGLINCVFPEAKVIFVARDPRDICLSCFMQIMVPTTTTVHLFDWKKTVNLYCQTMDWWLYIRDQISLDTIEFRYEDSISDFEATFRKIFSFLNLQWVSAANDFHKHAAKKFIASPSFNQVSQPLYSSSVARWKQYETEFETVIAKLQPYIDAFGYR
jgi:Tfp pilus assembly protein PilF